MNTEKNSALVPETKSQISNNNSSTETQFSKHVFLQRGGLAQTLLSNFKDLLSARPLKTTGVQNIQGSWGRIALPDEHHGRAQVFSLAVHGGLGLLLFLVIALQLPQSINPISNLPRIYLPSPPELRRLTQPIVVMDPGGGHGGGGEHNPTPVTVGVLPHSSPREQIVPPSLIRNPNARLQIMPILPGPEQFLKQDPNLNRWGDPNAPLLTDSNGPGSGPGMGDHGGIGIGPKGGNRYGDSNEVGIGLKVYGAKDGVRFPTCAYCPRPDYSDEARKAKYQGSVVLEIVVLPDGKPTRIQVISSPGLGLDEKAIEAVRNWRFSPGLGPNGKPAAVAVTIEVVFQLF